MATEETGLDEVVRARVTLAEKRAWQEGARKACLTLSEWIRERCAVSIADSPEPPEPTPSSPAPIVSKLARDHLGNYLPPREWCPACRRNARVHGVALEGCCDG